MAHRTDGATGGGAWNREADRLRILAAQVGWPLDEDAIHLLDVYDLRALRQDLEVAYRTPDTLRTLLRRIPWCGGAGVRKAVRVR